MKLLGSLALTLAAGAAGQQKHEFAYKSLGEGKHVLMVLTSNDELLGKPHQTGWYLPEAAHPYDVFRKAGVRMTWASPKGGEAPLDPSSVEAYAKDPLCVDFHTKASQAKLWEETVALKEVDGQDFDAVFVVGGFGVMGDLVHNEDLQKIVVAIHEHDGVVSGVCHGPAALAHVLLSDGSSLVKGKEVACFTDAEEAYMKENAFDGKNVLPGDTCEEAFKKAGAVFTEDKIWAEHVAIAGKLITGQNPGSARATAEAVVHALGAADHALHIEETGDVEDQLEEKTGDIEDQLEEKFDILASVPPQAGNKPSAASFLLLGASAMVFALVQALRRRGASSGEAELQAILEPGLQDEAVE